MGTMFTEESCLPSPGELQQKGTRKTLNMLFLVDVSGSMEEDGRMDAVNEAFEQMIPELQNVQRECLSDFELRVAIMTFDTKANWIVAPTPILEYVHAPIRFDRWATFYSKAFRGLNEVLTKQKYMHHEGKIAEPYIMFLTDGKPTANDNYNEALDELLQNAWFTNSQRFAVLIGKEAVQSDSARAAVARFVSNPAEGIISAESAVTLASQVQAKTLHTVVGMTKHNIVPESGDEPGIDKSGDEPGYDTGNAAVMDYGSGDDDTSFFLNEQGSAGGVFY